MDSFLTWSAVAALISFTAQQIVKSVVDYKRYRKEIVFSKLHEKRTVVLGELFEKLQLLNNAAYDFTQSHLYYEGDNVEEIEQKRGKVLDQSLIDAYSYFICKRIFLSEALCDKIGNIIEEYRLSLVQYSHIKSIFNEKDPMNHDYAHLGRERRKLSEYIKNDLPDLIKEVETEFRQILSSAQKG